MSVRMIVISIIAALATVAVLWIFVPQHIPWLQSIWQGLGEPGIGARTLELGIFCVLVIYVAARLQTHYNP